MRAATTKLPGYIANYRTPGLVDDEVAALQFEQPNGEIVATLLNLACHPEVLMSESKLISADYRRRRLPGRRGGGRRDGAACLRRAGRHAQPGDRRSATPLAWRRWAAPMPRRPSPRWPRRAGRCHPDGYAPRDLRPAAGRTRSSRWRRRSACVRRRPLENGQLTTSCVYIDLGPAQIIGVPGELLPRLGFELKAALPGPVPRADRPRRRRAGLHPARRRVRSSRPTTCNPGAQYEESMSAGPRTGSLVLAAAKGLIQRNA